MQQLHFYDQVEADHEPQLQMTTDVLSHFTKLDALIQAVYQGFDQFVVLSHVEELAWTSPSRDQREDVQRGT